MWSLPDTRPYRPLEFQEMGMYRTGSGDDMKCVWVGVAAIVIIYLMNRHTVLTHPRPIAFDAIAGLISRVNPVRAVSSRIQRALVESDLIDGCEVWPELKCGLVSLIDNAAVRKVLPPPPADESTKQINLQRLVKFVEAKENAKACIIIFAHWCPHCKTLIKELVEQANSGKSVSHKYLLVNGESVASEAFTGDKKVVDLKYYPTILCTIGSTGKEATSLQDANEILDAAPTPDAAAAETAQEATPEEEGGGNVLDTLF